MIKPHLLRFALLASLTPFARADVLFSETFTYPDATLLTAVGWNALSGTGTNNIAVNNNAVALATSGQDVSTNFTGTAVSSGDLYVGFDFSISVASATGDYFFGLSPNLTSNNYVARLHAKAATGGYQVGLIAVSGATAVYGSTVYSFGQTYRGVLDYSFITGALNDSVAFYVSPGDVLNQSNNTAAATSAWSGTNAESSLQTILLRQGTATNAATVSRFDNVNVTTDFASAATFTAAAIPEPSTYAAIAGGLILAVAMYRRQKRG